MSQQRAVEFSSNAGEIARAFLRIGAISYGGPAIMGLMQSEFQERRGWLSKERFLEGMSLVNILPGAGATQLAIFLGHVRGGWLGGLLAGLCFMLPGFAVMVGLAVGYAALGATVVMRGALYGLGPVVLAIFLVAVYRLGKNAVTGRIQVGIVLAVALGAAFTPLGVATLLMLAGGLGLFFFNSRRSGAIALAVVAVAWVAAQGARSWLLAGPAGMVAAQPPADLMNLGLFFLKTGALTFGGGLTMIAFIQEQVVVQMHWLSPQEFLDGLALGQFTPGPILMVAAYVGFKTAGVLGASVCAAAIFLPSFLLILGLLPALNRVRRWTWTKAAMRGVGPAVIGVMGVSLARMAPIALPDTFAMVLFAGAGAALLARISPLKLMGAGAATGAVLAALRTRLPWLGAVRSAL